MMMELVKSGANEITIRGNIKTTDDYLAIKKLVNSLIEGGNKEITIMLLDSIAMTSSVIGYLIKLINHDKIKVSLQISDYRLMELLHELNLTELFNARYTGVRKQAA
jgi:hypothetical protein